MQPQSNLNMQKWHMENVFSTSNHCAALNGDLVYWKHWKWNENKYKKTSPTKITIFSPSSYWTINIPERMKGEWQKECFIEGVWGRLACSKVLIFDQEIKYFDGSKNWTYSNTKNFMKKNGLLMESNSSLSTAISVFNKVHNRENGTLDTFRLNVYLIGSIQVQTQYTNLKWMAV